MDAGTRSEALCFYELKMPDSNAIICNLSSGPYAAKSFLKAHILRMNPPISVEEETTCKVDDAETKPFGESDTTLCTPALRGCYQSSPIRYMLSIVV